MTETDAKQDQMKSKLKRGVHRRCSDLIDQWQKERKKEEAYGALTVKQVVLKTKQKYQLLIRKCIEFSVEIWDPNFLFEELLPLFVQSNQQMLFAEELKPFILLGHFSDWSMSEVTLKEHILKHHQEVFI